ncbi:MAG: hypothetical protein GQ477_04915 [Nanohaloarchaea archaeon]|nr:hypothetical protein [Candidatus Nanohaloarchaea archaeon]
MYDMSTIFNLKDGREANIEIWNFDQLSEFADKKKENTSIVRTGDLCHFDDFKYLGPDALEIIDS